MGYLIFRRVMCASMLATLLGYHPAVSQAISQKTMITGFDGARTGNNWIVQLGYDALPGDSLQLAACASELWGDTWIVPVAICESPLIPGLYIAEMRQLRGADYDSIRIEVTEGDSTYWIWGKSPHFMHERKGLARHNFLAFAREDCFDLSDSTERYIHVAWTTHAQDYADRLLGAALLRVMLDKSHPKSSAVLLRSPDDLRVAIEVATKPGTGFSLQTLEERDWRRLSVFNVWLPTFDHECESIVDENQGVTPPVVETDGLSSSVTFYLLCETSNSHDFQLNKYQVHFSDGRIRDMSHTELLSSKSLGDFRNWLDESGGRK